MIRELGSREDCRAAARLFRDSRAALAQSFNSIGNGLCAVPRLRAKAERQGRRSLQFGLPAGCLWLSTRSHSETQPACRNCGIENSATDTRARFDVVLSAHNHSGITHPGPSEYLRPRHPSFRDCEQRRNARDGVPYSSVCPPGACG